MSRSALAAFALLAALAAPVRAAGPSLPPALWGDDGVATTPVPPTPVVTA